MELRQLRALLGIAEHGSFSAAADALETVQSNISAHVARLEKELGAVLVDRSGGQLTEAGRAVVGRARTVIEEVEAIVADVSGMNHEVKGTVRVGMIGTTARWLAAALLSKVSSRHPGVRLAIVDGTSYSLEPQLQLGRLDMAIVNLPVPHPDLRTAPLFEEQLGVVVSKKDPLAARASVQLADLARLPLLLPLPGTAFRDELDSALRAAGVSLAPRAEMEGLRLIASLTFEGHGPAILPATAIPHRLRRSWRLVPVEGLPPRLVGVAWRRRSLSSRASEVVLDAIRELVASGQAPEGVRPVPAERLVPAPSA
ncbi:MAG TPA: LysR family transcriptional regulator [Acidimicrobiales bacterium]|jgi:DNA-binding transcriptional LysR family regulator|nr:LysR family transcriptional regulator [Acidimicrobiales bacterium]